MTIDGNAFRVAAEWAGVRPLAELANAAGFHAGRPLVCTAVAQLMQDHLAAQGEPGPMGEALKSRERIMLAEKVRERLASMPASGHRFATALMGIYAVRSELQDSALWQDPRLAGNDAGVLSSKGTALLALPAQLPLRLAMPLQAAADEAVKPKCNIKALSGALGEPLTYISGQIERIDAGARKLQSIRDDATVSEDIRKDAAKVIEVLQRLRTELEEPLGVGHQILEFSRAATENPEQAGAALRQIRQPSAAAVAPRVQTAVH